MTRLYPGENEVRNDNPPGKTTKREQVAAISSRQVDAGGRQASGTKASRIKGRRKVNLERGYRPGKTGQ